MPPKRKGIIDPEEQLASKKLNTGSTLTDYSFYSLQTLPDDCLLEILGYLPPVSLCAVFMVCRRFNSVFETSILKDLSKKLDLACNIPQATKKLIKEIFFPKAAAQYLAFEKSVTMASENEDDNLEKLLGLLHNWFVLKISERVNSRQLKAEIPELWEQISGRYGYKEISPVNTFVLWDDIGNTDGGTFHVSFFLFGQKQRFAEVNCDLHVSHSEHQFTFCKLSLNAKLLSCSSTESTEVKGLLEGYQTAVEEDDPAIITEVLNGDRVQREWFHAKCYPKVYKEKLIQLNDWLGWNMSPLELAKVIAGLSMNPSVDFTAGNVAKNNDSNHECLDTSNVRAMLERLLSLALQKDDDHTLSLIKQTLEVLRAKVKLRNRIKHQWKDKDGAKLEQVTALVDRSMYTEWSHITQCFPVDFDGTFSDPNRSYSREVTGQIKLISDEPSQWLIIQFKMSWHRQDPEFHACNWDQADYWFSFSSPTKKRYKNYSCENGPWKVPYEEVKVFQNVLGLKSYTADEINELLGLITNTAHKTKK